MSRGRARRDQFEWILLGLALLILGALIGDWVYIEYEQIDSVERDRLQVQARVIDENLGRQLEGVNNALAGIRDDLMQWNGKTMSVAPSRRLDVLGKVMPGVRTLLIANAEGTVSDSSRRELIGRNFSEREYFKVPREHPDPDLLYISPPFRTVLGVVAIDVTRVLVGPQGEFAGIVTASLDSEYFDVLLRSVLYASDMRAVLAHWDGKAFLFMPPNERMVGVDLSQPGSFFSRHRESGQRATLLTGTSVISGEERIMASRTVKRPSVRMDKPLVIHLSREFSAIYLPWRKQALAYSVTYGLIALIAVIGLYFMQRRRRSVDLAAAHQEAADRLLLHFFDLPFVGMAITSPGTKHWLRFNDRMCETLGYSREELVRLTWAELTHPEDLDKDIAEFERVLRGESEGYVMDKRFIRKDGAVVFTTIDVKCTRNADGTVEHIIAMVQDISERKRAEDALEESREKYRGLSEAASESIFFSEKGVCIEQNRTAELTFGYSDAEALGRYGTEWFAPEDRDRVMQNMLRGYEEPYEVTALRKDGTTFPALLRGRMMQYRGRHVRVTSLSDITERKRAEAARDQLEAQLRESQKMEALGTLAGGVAHDFNNIVTTIMGNVELARQDVGPGHAALESLEEIGKASRRAKELVQQILAFGRRQVLERRVIALAPVVEESARLLRSTLPAGVSLRVECAPDAPEVLADAMQVERVLLNLCANAWQSMLGQTRPAAIELSLAPHLASGERYSGPERRTRAGRVALHPGLYACLTVHDTGPGMDPATRSRIFEPFFTTKPVGKGTGLGLAVVHGIVQDHGASIAVHSAPGEGATFRVYFPAAQAVAGRKARPAARAVPTESGEAPGLQGAGKSILYVDDDEAIVYLMTRLLERQGYRVSGYTDARDALAAVRAQPDAFDLVVTDFNMPGMSGLEVARELRTIRADLPVALASGYITEELRAQAPAAGVNELIYKPNTAAELCEVVARLANSLPV